MLIGGVLFLVAAVFFITIYPLSQTHSYLFLGVLYIPVLVSLIMYLVSVIVTITGDVGDLKTALRNPQNRAFLTPDFINSLPLCEKCGLPKPARCHHCSVCNKCHLKMDHHCPAVGVCIAMKNTQPFLCLLKWGSVLSLANVFVALYGVYQQQDNRTLTITVSVLLMFLCVVVYGFYIDFKKHAIINITTLENMDYSGDKYNIGYEENMKQVYGEGKLREWIPRKSKLTGFEWCFPEYACGVTGSPSSLVNQKFQSV